MLRSLVYLCVLAIAGNVSIYCNTTETMKKVPKAKKVVKTFNEFGNTRTDEYYWLRERENPEVVKYLEAENAYTEMVMADVKELENTLFDEIVGRIVQTDMSVPYKLKDYYYYTRFEEGKEYPIYCRKQGSLEAEEEIMLDGNVMAEGHDYFQIGGMTVSPDNKMIAYGVDTVSRRLYTVYFKNLETGEIMEESIPNTSGSAQWAADNKTLFFAEKDLQTLRTDKIYRYKLGTGTSPELIFEEKDETFWSFVYKTRSKEFLVIGSTATMTDEYRILSADDPDGEFQIVQERERGLEYSIGHFKDKLYIRTNLDAQNFRLMETPVTATSKENWKEVIPHREDVLLEGFMTFENFMVVDERKKGNTHLRIISMADGKEHEVPFGEEVYTAGISVNPEASTDWLRFGYTSMTTPQSTYDYNMKTGEMKLLKRQEVVGGHDPEAYQSERLYAPAEDGKMIPISLVYKKGTALDGSAPLLLYGYGSYGHTIDPSFSSARLSLLDRGFVMAIAHVRGGQFLGREWYEDGRMLNKINTFTDFIACGKHLVAQNYTSSDRMMASGGSAGGLLIGAVINLEPELFEGVIAAVPFVDVVTTMLDESIPLTTGEYDEWGNPNEKEYYDYMLSYSPYDNVEKKDYPHMLVTTGLHDSQVQYWEPAKWVARLREMKTDEHILIMHTNMDAGHGGASGRFKRHRETAMEYSFLLKLAGVGNAD